IAGDVPVQLVELTDVARFEEKPDRVTHPIADDDRSFGVAGARDIDVKALRPRVDAGILDHQRLAAGVSDADRLYIELRRSALCGVVMKQEIAIDPVPCARKTDLELLD